MDGQKQRQALTAAEQALRALIDGDGGKAAQAISRAVELDQVGIFAATAPLVEAAAADLDAGGSVGAGRWRAIAGTLGVGPLAAVAGRAAQDADRPR